VTLVFAAAFVISLVALGMALRLRRRRLVTTPLVPSDLANRVQAVARAIATAEPWRPAADPAAPEAAAAIEAALIAQDSEKALAAAEAELASLEAPAARVWLAWALCAHQQPAAALEQLARATDATGNVAALAAYVGARAEHLKFEHGTGATGAVPSLVTSADLAVVTLASGRGAATWLTGGTDVQLTAAQVKTAISEHREITARCLVRALEAAEQLPGFADAAYLVARLAVKAGAVTAATAVFDAVATPMAGRPDADAFARDRRDLADPANAVAAAKLGRTESPKVKRSHRLRVL
jgi:hypothetical protein